MGILTGPLNIVNSSGNNDGDLTVQGTITAGSFAGIETNTTEEYTLAITNDNAAQATFNIDHTLGERFVDVSVFDSDGNVVIVGIAFLSTTRFALHFGATQAAGTTFYIVCRK